MSTVKLYLAVIFLAVLVPFKAIAAAEGPETIRIAVSKGLDAIRISGFGMNAEDGDGNRLPLSFPLAVKREKSGISAGGAPVPVLKLSSPGVIRLNGKGYRGTIEVIPLDKGLLVVDELPLEEYLVGLINCEISSQWPIESVKAQAVVARSFAMYQKGVRKGLPYHLESTVYDQVYEGCDIEDSRAARAVEETLGEVLTSEGAVIPAFFHSSCGGHTESSENVWSMRLPYLRGVVCAYCMNSPSVLWEQTIPRKKLENLLRAGGYKVDGLREIRPMSRNRSGRIGSLQLVTSEGTLTVPAVTFRRLAGYGTIRSTSFEVKSKGDAFVFIGVGYGHGVGLCQWGAKKRAEEGFSYREILSYYYPGATLMKLDAEQ